MGRKEMESEKTSERFVRNLIGVMPGWHSELVRPFKDSLCGEMSLETYYCLETVRSCGSITMTELAQQLRVPKQQVTKLVDKLCSHQFIEREYREEDRRVIEIRLTPGAVSYLDEYYLKNTVFIKRLEERLTEKELQKLNAAVEVLGELLPKLK